MFCFIFKYNVLKRTYILYCWHKTYKLTMNTFFEKIHIKIVCLFHHSFIFLYVKITFFIKINHT